MADDKKPEAKPSGGFFFSHPDPFVEIVWIILSLLILSYFVSAFANVFLGLLNGGYTSSALASGLRGIALSIFYYILSLKYLFFLFYLILAGCIFHLLKKINALRLIENKLMYPEVAVKEVGVVNPHWERVKMHGESLVESDWRLAILEADIMLSDMLEKLALPGDTMAEKLKSVEKSDFTTIDSAWEAHKVRNQIAHEGATFMLNQREAKRVIGLYESVFKEFQII